MIIVTVELKSAIDGRREKLGEMIIANDATSSDPKVGNYDAFVYRKPKFFTWKSLTANMTRRSRVEGYRRQSRVIWDLVTLALKNMGYGK